MRQAHYLKRIKGDGQPARMVAVCCDATVTYPDSTGTIRDEHLAAWHCAGWDRDNHGRERNWSYGGKSQDALWAAVDKASSAGGLTWVVSYGTCRIWGLLGLWDRIEQGKVVLHGRDEKARRPNVLRGTVSEARGTRADDDGMGARNGRPDDMQGVQGLHATGQGACWPEEGSNRSGLRVCLEDPPTVVEFRLPGKPGRHQLVDLRNYGIDCYPHDAPLDTRVPWMLGVMRRICGELKRRQWGSLRATTGSQSIATFKRAHLTHAILCHDNPVALELERAAYVGGRCECGRLGEIKGPIHYLDVRSMYPYVCSQESLPSVLEDTGEGELPGLLDLPARGLGAIAEVQISTNEPAYPHTAQRPTHYPVGTFWTVLAGPELLHAQHRSRVKRWGRWAIYRLSPCLAQYARALYGAREEIEGKGDEPLKQWIKSMLVSLPGKFGQRGWYWGPSPDAEPPAPWCLWYHSDGSGTLSRRRSLGGQCQEETQEDWANDAVGSIAAWVTSAARMRLWEGITTAGREHVVYYDTDSLLVDAIGYRSMQGLLRAGASRLGGWRLVTSHNSVKVFGQKHYMLDSRVVCSGCPKGGAEDSGNGVAYWYRDWLKRSLQSRRCPSVRERLLSYHRPPAYRAGWVDAQGYVHPHVRQ